jgi:hypothetical protein
MLTRRDLLAASGASLISAALFDRPALAALLARPALQSLAISYQYLSRLQI